MRLTTYIHREGEQVMSQRSNRNENTLVLGILHEDTDQLLTIVVHPDGMLTGDYGKVGTAPTNQFVLGQFLEAGMLEMFEPRPIGTS